MKIARVVFVTLATLALAESVAAQTDGLESYERLIEEQQRRHDEMRRELDELEASSERSPEHARKSAATQDAPDHRIISRKNENLPLTFRGRLHDAQSIGRFAVQKWPDYGLDFYAGYRQYDARYRLERSRCARDRGSAQFLACYPDWATNTEARS